MTIKKDLKELVLLYASFQSGSTTDPRIGSYIGTPDHDMLMVIDEQFIKLINKALLMGGASNDSIEEAYKKLRIHFHPDKLLLNPELAWLNKHLFEGKDDGCLKALSACYELLINPNKFKEYHFKGMPSIDELKLRFEILKENTSSYAARNLYRNMIDLLDQAGAYFDETGKIKLKGLKLLLKFLPIAFAGFGVALAVEELFSIYALYFVLLKSGQYLENRSNTELQVLGRALQGVSVITATLTTTLLVQLLEMTFWVSRQSLSQSLKIGSSILKPLLFPIVRTETDTNADLYSNLIFASKNHEKYEKFSTPELQLIAAPLQSYLGLNAEQFLKSFRAGGIKRNSVKAFLFSMRVLDKLPESIEAKLEKAAVELDKLKSNLTVYSGNTERAVDQAEEVLNFLKDDPSTMQLVVYKN